MVKIKTSEDNKENAIVLHMNNAASFWNMTDDSNLTTLTLNNGAIVDMRADKNNYNTLTMEKLEGNGGVIKQDIDVRSMESDKVFVTKDFSGTQVLDIYQKDNYVPIGNGNEGYGWYLPVLKVMAYLQPKIMKVVCFTHIIINDHKDSDTLGYDTTGI